MNVKLRAGSIQTLLLAVMLVSTGCTHYKPLPLRTPQSYEETGDIHIGVVSVAPFEAVAGGLKPNFKIDSDKALAEALVTTQATQTSVSKASQFLLSASFPGADAPSVTASAPASPTAPKPSAPDLPTSVASPPALGAVTQHNAVLRYQLATALMQEVALLNDYVNDAPRKAGFDPFIIRMQMTVRPLARATPFDALANIRFSNATACPGNTAEMPRVIPLLVTDNEDVTSISSLDRNLTQLGLALSALKGAYGLGGSFGSSVDDVVSSMGWQYQSISNVARIDDQTISMRVNAMPTGVKRFELAPRVHNLTVLLLIKRPTLVEVCQTNSTRPSVDVKYEVNSRFIHATSGQALHADKASEEKSGLFSVRFWPAPDLPRSGQHAAFLLTEKEPFGAELLIRGGANLTERTVSSARIVIERDGKREVIEALDVAVAEKSQRQALSIQFSNLSKMMVADLMRRRNLQLELTAGEDAGRFIPPRCEGSRMNLEVIPDFLRAPAPAEPTLQAKVRTDRHLTVSRQGDASLSVAVAFPSGEGKGKVALTALDFDVALPSEPLVFQGKHKDCARIERGRVSVSGDCQFSVALKNLPLVSQASPSTKQPELKVTAFEYQNEAKPATAISELEKVLLQYLPTKALKARH